MTDPYQILGVPVDVDEPSLRRRYLELVREFPPEQAPERFAEIREAYERLRNPVRRLESQLFEIEHKESLADILGELWSQVQSRRIPTDLLLSFADR